ncbi:hypothetical protein MTR_3g110052 [Medicago truncatula]|uniref:Uncharacterized protein n=1 Tax=Medicago truncatula TaxID=3880 RepID=G7ZWL7_MEDTR|nr:hypothetical protein MTR_3g110052 [Medicago truncatula]
MRACFSNMKEAKQVVVAQVATSNTNGIVDLLHTAQGFQPLFIQVDVRRRVQ